MSMLYIYPLLVDPGVCVCRGHDSTARVPHMACNWNPHTFFAPMSYLAIIVDYSAALLLTTISRLIVLSLTLYNVNMMMKETIRTMTVYTAQEYGNCADQTCIDNLVLSMTEAQIWMWNVMAFLATVAAIATIVEHPMITINLLVIMIIATVFLGTIPY